MGMPRWEWADEGGEMGGGGIWELRERSGEMVVGRCEWGEGSGELRVGRWELGKGSGEMGGDDIGEMGWGVYLSHCLHVFTEF